MIHLVGELKVDAHICQPDPEPLWIEFSLQPTLVGATLCHGSILRSSLALRPSQSERNRPRSPGTRRSRRPRQRKRAELAAEGRRHVLSRPLLADLPVIVGPVDASMAFHDAGRSVAGIPSKSALWVAVTSRHNTTKSALPITSCPSATSASRHFTMVGDVSPTSKRRADACRHD
jgi:hypothetical protein